MPIFELLGCVVVAKKVQKIIGHNLKLQNTHVVWVLITHCTNIKLRPFQKFAIWTIESFDLPAWVSVQIFGCVNRIDISCHN